MKPSVIRIKHFCEWPAADRRRWRAARHDGGLLGHRGLAAEWSPKNARVVMKSYGQWLTWHEAEHGSLQDVAPAQRASKNAIRGYVLALQARVGSITVASRVRDVYHALRVMCPGADLSYLKLIVGRLQTRARPGRNKRAKLRHSLELYEAGLSHIADAERDRSLYATLRAARYRDGLFVAFLALRPLRLDNARLIVLGVHVRQTENGFRFGFETEELKWKNGPALEFDLPGELVPHFHRYLEVYRPILLHGRVTDPLWIATRGKQMSDQAVRQQVNAVTKQRIGVAITPHLFRDCAATSIAMDNPEHAEIVSRILGHAALKTAEKHYIHGRSIRDSRLHAELLLDLREAARRARRPQAERPLHSPPDAHSHRRGRGRR